jgi:hypothetical protein
MNLMKRCQRRMRSNLDSLGDSDVAFHFFFFTFLAANSHGSSHPAMLSVMSRSRNNSSLNVTRLLWNFTVPTRRTIRTIPASSAPPRSIGL